MKDEDFTKLMDELSPMEFGAVDWQTLTPPQQTVAAVLVLFPMADGDYDGLAEMLSVLNVDAYVKAFDDLGFPETAVILRKVATIERDALLGSDELFELAVDLEYNEREIWGALEKYAKTHALFLRLAD